MSRPRLPDNQLKHPRRIRKSTSSSQRLDVKPPTKAQQKRWKPILDAAIMSVIGNPERNDNLQRKNKMDIFFVKGSKPNDFPVGRLVESNDKGDLIRYNSELVLLYLYERFYTDYTPNMLYRSRGGCIGMMTELDKMLDVDLDSVLECHIDETKGE